VTTDEAALGDLDGDGDEDLLISGLGLLEAPERLLVGLLVLDQRGAARQQGALLSRADVPEHAAEVRATPMLGGLPHSHTRAA